MADVILVTGADGFVGTALTSHLERRGREVVRFSRRSGHDLLATAPFASLTPRPVACVVHLAARSFIPQSWSAPQDFYAINTMGTLQVLEFCRQTGARLLYASTYVYGRPRYLPVDEGHPAAPGNPYTHSKWLAEELCRFYAAQHGVRVCVLRPFNLYGPGQARQFLVAQVVGQFLAGEEIVVNDLRPRRDYLYIDDFVEACSAVLDRDSWSDVYNVGYGASLSVEEVLRTLEAVAKGPVRWRSTGLDRRDEIPDVVARCRLVEEGLWKPRVSFAEGLARTLENHR